MKPLFAIIVAALTVAALYVATAGWLRAEARVALKQQSEVVAKPVVYDGVTFSSETARDHFIYIRDTQVYFPWAFNMPYSLSLLLTCISFGFIGGVSKLLYDVAYTRSTASRVFARLCLSALAGVLVLGICVLVPSALSVSELTIRPVALIFLSLFSGVFSRQFFSWLQNKFQNFLYPTKPTVD